MFDLNHFDLASDGQEAIDLFVANEYQMVITDIQMPLLSGSEVASKIRRSNRQIPIIALTANILDDQLSEYYEAGINDYVAKPIDISKLKAVLEKYLSWNLD